jgi:hypothetical protein
LPPGSLVSVLPDEGKEQPQVGCLLGFSKDYCNGSVVPGAQSLLNCITPIPEGTCRTLKLAGEYTINLASSGLACGHSSDEGCDETIDGRLRVGSTFLIRLQDHCPYRGCWSGRATFAGSDNSVYTGTLLGTMGVGTHRSGGPASTCAVQPGTRDCEKCYDASFDPLTSTWRIGYEAVFQGERSDVVTGQQLCFSLSGDFFIPGTLLGGPLWGANTWRVNGTADGVHFTFCP